MRLRQLRELIHNSSNHYGIDKAAVKVTFKEIEEQTTQDLKEPISYRVIRTFTISRNVYSKDSHSDYEIDNKVSTKTEVVDLLKSKGIDMNNNRFLILQGEVEQISLMKPMSGKRDEPGLLEYLEDIIGSGRYVDQIAEVEVTYAEIKRQKENEMLLLHDMKKDMESMEEHKERAVRFMEAEKRIMCLGHLKINLSIHQTRDKDKENDDKIERLEDERTRVTKELEEVVKEHAEIFKELRIIDSESKIRIEKISKIELSMQEATKQDQELHSKIKVIISDSLESANMKDRNLADVKRISSETQEMKQKLPKVEKEADRAGAIVDELDKKEKAILRTIEPQVQKIRAQIQKISEQEAPLERDIKRLEAHMKNMRQEMENLDQKDAKAVTEIERLEKELQECLKSEQKQAAKREKIEEDQKASQEKLARIDASLKEYDSKGKELMTQLKDVEARLNEKTANSEDLARRNHVLSYLLNSKEARSEGRIFGRLGDLGSIDIEYDIAISATSPQYNSILVDHTKTATRCMQILKQYQIGHANFLTLNRFEHFRAIMNRPFSAPPNTKRLFDLVKTKDEDSRLAFYFLLQDTLVVENIDIAQQVAYNRQPGSPPIKVVTKQGYIINPDGTMAGGGRPRRGLVGTRIVEAGTDDPQELHRTKEGLLGTIKMLNDESTSMRNDIQKLKADLNRIPGLLSNIDTDLTRERQSRLEVEGKLKALAQQRSDQRSATARMETAAEIDKGDREKRKLESEMSALEAKKKELDDQIVTVGGEDLKEIKEKLKAQKEILEKAEQDREKLRAEIKKNETVVEEKTREIEETASRLTKAEEEKAALLTRKKEIEDRYYSYVLQQSELNKEKQSFDAEFEAMSGKIQECVEKVKLVKDQKSRIHEMINAIRKDKEVIKGEIQRFKIEMEENRRNYLNFVANFSILEELKKMEQQGSQEVDGDQDSGSNKRRANDLTIDKITPDVDVTKEELTRLGVTKENLNSEMIFLKNEKQSLGADTEVIEAYKKNLMNYMKKDQDYKKIADQEATLRNDLKSLKERRRLEFMTGFTFISKTLKQVYQTITNGGDADLELIDSYDPFAEGIMFSVRPPHKNWKHMSKLSGGEKTLSSLSLIFALHYYKPTPIYFMDEIDAALDFRNVEIVARFIKERTKNAQFIVISLRNHMFELANQLVGIYKVNEVTRTIGMYPSDFLAKIEDEFKQDEESKRRSQALGLSRRVSRMSQNVTQNDSIIPEFARKSVAAGAITRMSRAPGLKSSRDTQLLIEENSP